jgi:hypothetical protein
VSAGKSKAETKADLDKLTGEINRVHRLIVENA